MINMILAYVLTVPFMINTMNIGYEHKVKSSYDSKIWEIDYTNCSASTSFYHNGFENYKITFGLFWDTNSDGYGFIDIGVNEKIINPNTYNTDYIIIDLNPLSPTTEYSWVVEGNMIDTNFMSYGDPEFLYLMAAVPTVNIFWPSENIVLELETETMYDVLTTLDETCI